MRKVAGEVVSLSLPFLLSSAPLFLLPLLAWEAHHDFALPVFHGGDITQTSEGSQRTRPYAPEDVSWTLHSKEVLLLWTEWGQHDLLVTPKDWHKECQAPEWHPEYFWGCVFARPARGHQ